MVRKAAPADAPVLARLAAILWEHDDTEELTEEYEHLTASSEAACFLFDLEGESVGFAQCQLRHDYVEGTDSSPVGYLEGIFVKEGFRRQGVARALLTACEGWAKDMGCREFASDCELDNLESFLFHKALGFLEANRIICFTKALN